MEGERTDRKGAGQASRSTGILIVEGEAGRNVNDYEKDERRKR